MPEGFVDDPTIPDGERLLRRIHPSWLIWDEHEVPSISSAAFKDPELSVYLESVLIKDGRARETCVEGYTGYGLASITAGAARSLNLIVARDPQPQEPAHGIVLGEKKRQRVAAKLRDGALWVKLPPVKTI